MPTLQSVARTGMSVLPRGLGTLVPTTRMDLTEWIKQYARALGFDLVGVAPEQPPPPSDSFLLWLA
ncbi:MAG: hypothetical protein ACK4RG_01820, partial [Fimbriimonadales bacterium]